MASGRLILPLAEPTLDNTGAVAPGATLTVYIAGGAVLASLFAEAALATPISNPQTSNAAGRFYSQSTEIWADATQAYDCVLSLPDGESFTYANVYLLGAATNVSGFAPINSPTFTGNPQAPTTATNDSSNSLATTSFVKAQNYAPLNSPALTGSPTAPTQATNDNTTKIATDQFVQTAIGLTAPSGTTTGFMKFLGVYLQWTTFSLGAAGGATQAITWPTAFPTAVLGKPWISCDNAALEMIGVTAVTTAGATVQKGATDGFARTGTVWALGN